MRAYPLVLAVESVPEPLITPAHVAPGFRTVGRAGENVVALTRADAFAGSLVFAFAKNAIPNPSPTRTVCLVRFAKDTCAVQVVCVTVTLVTRKLRTGTLPF